MENKEILVSIGMPVYNGEKYICEALDSALSQTYTNFELIISDNGSTDRTEEICREYQKKDHRIQYVRHNKNRGGHFNLNFCAQKASGLYFTLLAHDDILENNFLEKTITYLSDHKECVLVSGDFEFINESGLHMDNLKLGRTREETPWKSRLCEIFKYPTSSKIYLLMYGLMLTDMIKKVYPTIFMIKMTRGSEVPMLCRIAIEGQMVSIPEVLRKCRLHDNSTSRAEGLTINKKFSLVKRYILFKNVCQIRFDQARVVIKSHFLLSQKLFILYSVYMEYFKNFMRRLFHLPKKILSYIK